MIIEGIVTTSDADGAVNVAPMGPIVSGVGVDWSELILRPYPTSRTYANLKQTGQGVFHVTDDVGLFAEAIVSSWQKGLPALAASDTVATPRLADCCRYYEFNVVEYHDEQSPTRLVAKVVAAGEVRPFIGFHRARHAVIEAAILASRVGILAAPVLRSEFERLRPLVDKTADEREREAYAMIAAYLERRIPADKE